MCAHAFVSYARVGDACASMFSAGARRLGRRRMTPATIKADPDWGERSRRRRMPVFGRLPGWTPSGGRGYFAQPPTAPSSVRVRGVGFVRSYLQVRCIGRYGRRRLKGPLALLVYSLQG